MAALLLLFSLAFGLDLIELEKKAKEAMKEIEKKGLHKQNREKVEEYKKKLESKVKEVLRKAKRNSETGEYSLKSEGAIAGGSSTSTIYIFMSSSVPEVVWKRYARYVDEEGLPAVFLLRGCVGGCKYVKPTLEFIQRIVKDGKRELKVEVWIDPLKFREYGVKAVPCVAVEGRRELSCGDWNLRYHLEKLGWSR